MKQLITLTAFIFLVASGFSQTKEQDSLVLELAYIKQDSVKVDTSIKLIKSFYDSNDYKRALDYIDLSEQLATVINYQQANAEIKYYKALIYSEKDDYYNAIDNYNKSLTIYTQLDDALGIAKVNNSLGLIEIKRGNYSKGLTHSLSAIDIFESRNLRSELSLAYNNLAEAYFNTNQFDKSLEYNTKALHVREILLDTVGIIVSTKNIAQLYSMRKEHRKAIEYYEKTLRYLDKKTDLDVRSEILPNIGEEYLRFNDINKATPYLLEGLSLNRKLGNKKGMFKSWNNLADLNLKLKKVRLAEYQLGEANKYSNEANDDKSLLKYYGLRVSLDSTKGNFKNAFYWQNLYHNLKSELTKQEQVPIIIESLPIENIDNTSTNPALNSDELKQNEANVKTQKIYIYILGGLLVLAILGLILSLTKRNKNVTILTDLEEDNKQLKIQRESILEQTRHLEEMNQVKDRLFSIVSHDLKDSITGVKAFLDLLKEDSISKDEFDQLIPELSENADNASALLLNLLNWSKSQMQNLEPKPELFNIQEVFKEKINLIEKKVEKKRVILLDESIKDFVFADKSMVEIIVQNLLANAVKFSKIGDVITVSNRERNGNVLICIEDTGVGISIENQKKLFTNGGFTTRGTNSEKGTGLGLSICKQLVDLNHGKIWVESEPNLGSKFFVELPKEKA